MAATCTEKIATLFLYFTKKKIEYRYVNIKFNWSGHFGILGCSQ